MAEKQPVEDDEQQQLEAQDQQTVKAPSPSIEEMVACVDALETALLPCLTEISKAPVPDYEPPSLAYKEYISEESMAKREALAVDLTDDRPRPPSPPLQSTVEKHVEDFMEAAKKLQRCFISLQRDHRQPTKAEKLRKEIAAMEEELKRKNELIEKQEKVIKDWKSELKDRFEKHNAELERV